jgi:hypothetical protein
MQMQVRSERKVMPLAGILPRGQDLRPKLDIYRLYTTSGLILDQGFPAEVRTV